MLRPIMIALLLVAAATLAASALPGYPYPTVWGTVTQVVDGNTIVIEVVGASDEGWIAGSTETVRYLGSYASPTAETFCGAVATPAATTRTFSCCA